MSLSPNMRKALLRLQELGRPAEWPEFSVLKRSDGRSTNVYRCLLARAVITDVNKNKTAPKQALYVLSRRGERELYLLSRRDSR